MIDKSMRQREEKQRDERQRGRYRRTGRQRDEDREMINRDR
jgi:hypothetical protein